MNIQEADNTSGVVALPSLNVLDARAHLESVFGQAPPLLSERLRSGAFITGRWTIGTFRATVESLPDYLVVACHGGSGTLHGTSTHQLPYTRMRRGAFSILGGEDGDSWSFEGKAIVSVVGLPRPTLHACAQDAFPVHSLSLQPRRNEADSVVHRIMDVLSDDNVVADTPVLHFADRTVDALAIHLLRAHSNLGLAIPERVNLCALPPRKVQVIKDVMESRLAESIDVDELCQLVGLSRSYFSTAFRRATGQSPHQFLTSLRMQRAMELLANAKTPVTAIALDVGFQTTSAFSATFRKVTGTTPSRYRATITRSVSDPDCESA